MGERAKRQALATGGPGGALPAARHPPTRGDRRRRGRAARHQQPESGIGDSGEVGALGGPPARTGGGAGTRRGKSSQRR